jgi:translation initiation factor eIF-2B subunit delta
MLAHSHGVPALVCCETYKFAERVLLDSICFNELGDPDELIPPPLRPATGVAGSAPATAPAPTAPPAAPAAGGGVTTASAGGGGTGSVADWRDIPRLKLLNLLYDATPMKYLTMVVTEVGVIPPTSVPAVIREASAREGV